ncbi:hypothetical protein N7449_004985 [Penicillium cf. viridicatum]|uniref:Reverse transcriptase Ty1/copia-type domain-containing protein n=1 Tax=Penicillium cf. viridicatum TaxID=2972119 RepID=A0A9W9MK95_9EURO|nr:hypothetical protein N7449_004985 [Penicillium cf. viridicatum]
MAQSDNYVFYKSNCVICVYVDNFLVATATSHEIDQVQRALEKEFRLNDLRTPQTYQTKSTPMNPKQVLNRRPDEEPPDEETKARFATAIGSLIYLMVGTRPDIAFTLGTLSRFTSQPQSHH